jgi:ATP adenylyltransferase
MDKKLWAPWRMDYILSDKSEEGCIFCTKPARELDFEDLLLFRGEYCYVLMNLYPYNNGHLLVIPYMHTDQLESISLETMNEMNVLIQASMKILRIAMVPDGFNIGLNQGAVAGAGIAEHVHFHIVPRWTGDTNFMPITGHTKVLVQGLQETYNLLKPLFEKRLK